MAKKKFILQDDRLYTEREYKTVKPGKTSKKVFLEKSEYVNVKCAGRVVADVLRPICSISTKDLKSRKFRKGLMAEGIIW